MPCADTIQNRLPTRASPTGVRRAFPVLRPIVSRSAYPGGAIPKANKSLIGWVEHIFLERVHNLMFDFCHHDTSAVYAVHCTKIG